MNDELKDLLTLAAKACGYEVARFADDGDGLLLVGVQDVWRPHLDDGDSLRLAIACNAWPYASSTNRIGVWRIRDDGRMQDIYGVDCWWGEFGQRPGAFENWRPTKTEAVRFAVLLAAAEIGKGIK